MGTVKLKPGQIITFYSYKGGTGRSMAVANCAWWLAKNFPALPRRILMMDWDLEAPGLHRYFAETTERGANLERPGVINYFDAIRRRLRDDPRLYELIDDEEGWRVFGEEFPLDDYVVRDVVGGVDLVKAGRYDSGYAELISTFDWVDFYNEYGAVFPAFRDFLLRAYDFSLIDSRTGLNDVSGICTMLLPERLVAVFTPNRQNVSGVLDLISRAVNYRLGSGDPRTLSVFPLPSRIENAEQELMEYWQETYQQDFQTMFKSIYKMDECDLTAYFDDVQLPHVSFYSYGEEVALRREERSGALSLSRAYEVFFDKLFGLKFAWDKKAQPVVAPAPVGSESFLTAPPAVIGASEGTAAVSGGRYESDIFISYAQIDNRPLSGGGGGWVETFHQALATRLGQLLGEQPKVWRDQKLRGNDFFDDMLVRRLHLTNLFVATITPGYVKSEWCTRELEVFYRQAEGDEGVVVGGRSRIIKVVKTPVEYERWPVETEVGELLSQTRGYDFYELDAYGMPREFDPRTGGDLKFWLRLDDLAYDLKRILEAQARGAEHLPPAPGAPGRATVYLAETTPDLEFQRDRVRRELQLRGYEVLPDGRLPTKADAFRKAVNDYLDRSRLSVHLVGDLYGTAPEGETHSAAEIQNEAAAQRSADANFSRVIWMPIGLEPPDPRQRAFVARLRSDAGAQKGADLLESSLEGLKALVQRRLESAPGRLQTPAGDGPVRVYLIFDARDVTQAVPLRNYLFDFGYEVVIPPMEGQDEDIVRLHKENLLLCDAALIYYGQASHFWLLSKLNDFRKALGWGRAEPMLARAVLMGPPATAEKGMFRTHEALVMKNFGDFDPEVLLPFVEAIEQAREARQRRNP